MEDNVPNDKEKVVGSIILLVMVVGIVGIGGIESITLSITLILMGLFSLYLYSFKTKTWLVFFLKVVANILFNPLYIILLIKSWTMLRYKEQLDELDRNPKEGNS